MRVVFTYLLLGFLCPAFAQAPTWELKGGNTLNYKIDETRRINTDSDGESIYTYFFANMNEFHSNRYDIETLSLKGTLDYEQKGTKYRFNSTISIGTKVIAVFHAWDKPNKQYLFEFRQVNGDQIDTEIAFTFSAPIKKPMLATTMTIGLINSPNDQFHLAYTTDHSYLIEEKAKGEVLFTGLLINNEGSQVTRTAKMEQASATMKLLGTGVDDDGSFFLLYKAFDDKVKNKDGGEINFDIYLYTVSADGKTQSIKIPANGHYLKDYPTAILRNGKVAISGFFVTGDDNYREAVINGVFSIQVDVASNTIAHQAFNKWNVTLLKEAGFDDTYLKKGFLKSFEFSDIIPAKKGGFYYLGERLDYNQVMVGGVKQFKTENNDLVVGYCDGNGQHQWVQRIKKVQKSATISTPNVFSAHGFESGGNLHIIYNDNSQNVAGTYGKSTVAYKSGVNMSTNIRVASFDTNTGAVSYSNLTNGTNYAAMINSITPLPGNKLLIPLTATNNKTLKLTTLQLE